MTPLPLTLHLLALTLLFVSLAQQSKARISMAKKGCRRECGNLTIPYPFGIGKRCSFAQEFEIECDDSSGVATLSSNGVVIPKISEDNFLGIGRALAFTYKRSSGKLHSSSNPTGEDFLGEHFSFSHTGNKFVAVGCDIYAFVADADTKVPVVGCAALCISPDIGNSATLSSSSCSGIRCCQATLPRDLTNTKMLVHTINTNARSWSAKSNQCGFSIIAAKDFSDFSKFNTSKCDETYEVPIVLDWSVGNLSCQSARARKDYACGENTYCVNSTSRGAGYHCRCLPGFDGNPYLPNGCKDIDECKTPKSNDCPKEAHCFNTPGSYRCTCSPGYVNANTEQIGKLVCIREKRNHSKILFISLGVGLTVGFLTILATAWLLYVKLRKRKDENMKKKFFKRNGGLLLHEQRISSSISESISTKIFSKEELHKATDNFSQNRVLGQGGHGTVYKGMLSNGSIVAVKKSNKVNENQVEQFINEVSILSQINHRHIVKLLGCCLETEVPLLVYEYVSNGTLSNHLHVDWPNVSVISWENRLRVAAECAGALAYMHSHASTAIFHRDIKSSNILLDENFRAVISDFGLSRSVSIDKSHLTTFVGGTFGYLDPEYFMTGQLNDRSDVYAFGVILAELLTGRKAICSNRDDEGLAIWFQSSMNEGQLFDILETTVAREAQEEEITTMGNLAKKCMNLSARNRPSMKEVASELDKLWMSRRYPEDKSSVHDYDQEDIECSVIERSYSCNIDITTQRDPEYMFSF